MTEERIVERTDGVTAERVTERGGGTTVIERRGSGGGLILGIIALVIVVVGAFYFLSNNSETRKDAAITEAAEAVGATAEKAGDAIDKAVPAEKK